MLRDGPKPASVVVRGTTATSRLELTSKPSSYDEYRGVLRLRPSAAAPTVTVVNELPLETYLRGVVPVEMPSSWPTEALRAQAIASRSYAARRLRPGVSYYDVTDDTSSQVYRGALGEKATTNAILAAEPGVVLRSGSAIANTLFHSTGGGATENNENVYVSSTGAKVAGAVSYLRGSPDRARRRDVVRRGVPVRHLADDDVHRRPALGLVRRRCADGRRHPACHRPAPSGRVRAADQRHARRLGRDEDGLGRRVPLGLQRPPPGDRSDAPEHAVRVRADPLTPATVAR